MIAVLLLGAWLPMLLAPTQAGVGVEPDDPQQAAASDASQPGAQGQSDLAALAAEWRWDEVRELADARLAQDDEDDLARYWHARAEIERALPLLGGRTFSRDLGHSILLRAGAELALVAENAADATADAREWEAYVRYLRADDEALAADLEAWFESEGRGQAAFLRGLVARDHGRVAEAEQWFAKACAAEPERGDFALEHAGLLARDGRKDEALLAWSAGVRAGMPTSALLAVLADVLPGARNAAERLVHLDQLAACGAAPSDGLFAWHRAWTLDELQRPEDAVAALGAATEGRSADLERVHARLLRQLGRPAEAAERLESASRQGSAAALSELVSMADEMALAFAWDDAQALYDVAFEIEPRDERAAVNRALMLAMSGRSLAEWEQIAARHPERADLINGAALHFDGWGREDEARQLFERAALLSGSQDARQNLAGMLLRTNPPEADRAFALLDSVVADDPSRDWAIYLRHLSRRALAR